MRRDSKLVKLIKNVLGGPGYAARNKFHQLKKMRAGDKEARAQSRRDALEVLAGPAAIAIPDRPVSKAAAARDRYTSAMAFADKTDMPARKKKSALPWLLQEALARGLLPPLPPSPARASASRCRGTGGRCCS